MPLTDFQKALARLLSVNRSPDSYLAGGAALHIEPNSQRRLRPGRASTRRGTPSSALIISSGSAMLDY